MSYFERPTPLTSLAFTPVCVCLLAIATGVLAQSKQGVGSGQGRTTEHGWQLSQLKGGVRSTMYVCPKGIKYGPDEQGNFFVSHAPGWTLHKYNPESKTCSVVSPEEMNKKHQGLPAQMKLTDTSSDVPPGFLKMLSSQDYTQGKTATIAGVPAIQYTSPRGRDTSEIMLARDIVLPAKANQVADYIYNTPNGIRAANRIVLRRQIIEKRGNLRTFFSTTLVTKEDIPLSTFDLPGGMQQANSK